MKEFLKKIKLIENFQIQLNTDRNTFYTKLKDIVEYGGTDYFSSMFEVFSSDKREYRGSVNYDSFKIKRKRKLFDTNYNIAVASGKISDFDGKTNVNIEINSFSYFFIPFFIILIIFYSFFIFSVFFSGDNPPIFVIFFIFLHACLMFGLPYFIARRSVKRMKYELEREFVFITQK